MGGLAAAGRSRYTATKKIWMTDEFYSSLRSYNSGANHAVVRLLAEEALTGEAKEGSEAAHSALTKPAKDVAPLPLDAIGAVRIFPFRPSRYGTTS
jgi:hypothetical protein